MKPVELKKLIKKKFLLSSLIPLFTIEIVLIITYFVMNNFVIEENKTLLLEDTKQNVHQMIEQESQKIDLQLEEISRMARLLQEEQSYFFKNLENIHTVTPVVLTKASNNTHYKKERVGSSVFASTNTLMFPRTKEKIAKSTFLDRSMINLVENNKNIVAAYLNTYDDINIYYPYIKEVYKAYPANLHMQDYNFYYDANAQNNPQKKEVWTDAYLDPAGQGWMLSCIVPIYNDNFLEGVAGIDVTIESFIKQILGLKLPWKSSAFLVNADNTVLAMPEKIEQLLQLKELTKHLYVDTIKETVKKPKEYNLRHNKEFFKQLERVKKTDTLAEFSLQGKEYLLGAGEIKTTGWRVLFVVEKDEIFKSIYQLESFAKNVGYLAIALLVVFYVLFFIYLTFNAKKMAEFIARPIEQLLQTTLHFSKKEQDPKIEKIGVAELDNLSDYFHNTKKQLLEHTSQLEDLNQNLEKRVEEEVRKSRSKDQFLVHKSKLAAMGEMIEMIAHQWRQPLTIVSICAESILMEMHGKKMNAEIKSNLDLITDQTDYLSKTIDDFRNFFQQDKKSEITCVCDITMKAVFLVRKSLEKNKIKIEQNFCNSVKTEVYRSELMQVILNLIKNAQDALISNKIEKPYVKVEVSETKESIIIEVSDNALGIDEKIQDKIFEPYFSTKDVKSGTGLGLYIAKTIIEDHMKGTLDFFNTEEGVCFRITLGKVNERTHT